MAEFPALPFWTDAYLADTRHLSTLEHGAYLLLLFEAWRRPHCNLPDDDAMLARLAGLSGSDWKAIKSTVMAFWKRDGRSKTWSQKRLSLQRDVVRVKSKSQRDKSAKRWNKTGKDDAPALPRECPDDANQSQNQIAAKAACADDSLIVDLAHEITAGTPLSTPDYGKIVQQQALVREWIEAGADPDMIRQTVKGRLAAMPSPPRSLKYFDGAIREAVSAKADAAVKSGDLVAQILGRKAA